MGKKHRSLFITALILLLTLFPAGSVSAAEDLPAAEAVNLQVFKLENKNDIWVQEGEHIAVSFTLPEIFSGLTAEKVRVRISGKMTDAEFIKPEDGSPGYYYAVMKVDFTPGEAAGDEKTAPGLLVIGELEAFRVQVIVYHENPAVTETEEEPVFRTELKEIVTELKFYIPPAESITLLSDTVRSENFIVTDGMKFDVRFYLGRNIKKDSVAVKYSGHPEVKAEPAARGYFKAVFTAGSAFKTEDNEDIKIEYIKYTDARGAEITVKADMISGHAASVRYYAPLEKSLKISSFESDNSNPKAVLAGDTVTLVLKAGHPFVLTDAMIENMPVSSSDITSSEDGKVWTVRHKIRGTQPDLSAVVFSFSANDGTEGGTASGTENDTGKITYYGELIVTDFSVESTNPDPLSFVKNGETVKIKFRSNHPLKFKKASRIASSGDIQSSCEETEDGYLYTVKHKVKSGDIEDLEYVTFSIEGYDGAGNSFSVRHSDEQITCRIQYYAPISASVSFKSDIAKKTDFARNGSLLIIQSDLNHEAKITASSAAGRSLRSEPESKKSHTLTYQIPSGESKMPEGAVEFSVTFEDAAGNVQTFTENSAKSQVTYDRTVPGVIVRPDFSGFSSSSFYVTAEFSDLNLDPASISLRINGAEQIKGAVLEPGRTDFEYRMLLSGDGTYRIIASGKDLASNRFVTAAINITIDRTAPKISPVSIGWDNPAVFSGSFVISEYFRIDEENIKNLICKVTDNDITQDWDIDVPITSEGKKTIFLLVEDMADNSTSMTFDIFIKNTPPKIIVEETVSGNPLLRDSRGEYFRQVNFKIYLEKTSLDERPDFFTKLWIVDKDGNVRDLLLEQPSSDGVYTVTLSEYGEYTIIADAQDHAISAEFPGEGNKTTGWEASFVFENDGVMKSMVSAYVIFGLVGITLAVFIYSLLRQKFHPKQRRRGY